MLRSRNIETEGNPKEIPCCTSEQNLEPLNIDDSEDDVDLQLGNFFRFLPFIFRGVALDLCFGGTLDFSSDS